MKVRLEYEDATEELKTVSEILFKLRYHTERWQKEYGANNRATKKYWEEKADQWCSRVIKETL